jgi:hypothetical protein
MKKKDTRTIKLDPMEWRDAMRDAAKKPALPAPKVKKSTRAGTKRSKSG